VALRPIEPHGAKALQKGRAQVGVTVVNQNALTPAPWRLSTGYTGAMGNAHPEQL
jgi:hypothetical protein